MRGSDIIDELKTYYKEDVEYGFLDRHLTEADVERWCNLSGWNRPQLFDEVAMCLARGFHSSQLSFDFCDMVVNDLASPVTNTSGSKPRFFWEVYSAFDEGEYFHGNNRNEDPVEGLYSPDDRSIRRES
jgi:hypothetical protein